MLQLAAVYISSVKGGRTRALWGFLSTPDELWQGVWLNTAAHRGSWRWYVSSFAPHTNRASYFQMFSTGCFPHGHVNSSKQIWEIFHLARQVTQCLAHSWSVLCPFTAQTTAASPCRVRPDKHLITANTLTSDKCLLRALLLNRQNIPLSRRWPPFLLDSEFQSPLAKIIQKKFGQSSLLMKGWSNLCILSYRHSLLPTSHSEIPSFEWLRKSFILPKPF